MVHVFSGDNSSQLYLEAIVAVMRDGRELSPRGKKIKELHPAVIEYTNPYNRVTFLKERKINPFFQLAEALWILLGRADVAFLTKYNKNMANFSDDGVYFNASYGERLRNWGLNSPRGFVFTPIDQLRDAYRKLEADHDTRQAFATIGSPRFDDAEYTLNGGKDIACNREIYFKIRDNKLDITVSNRSNDVHWGTWGANLNQFATIQEMMAAWLNIEVGTYYHIPDSLHIYTEDYGSDLTKKVLDAYGISDLNMSLPVVEHFTFDTEPRMSKVNPDEFDAMLASCEHIAETLIHNDDNILNPEIAQNTLEIIQRCPDRYFMNTLFAMVAYRAHRLGSTEVMINALGLMADSQWKLSCLYFLYNTYKDNAEYNELFEHYTDSQKAYIKGN